jgi:hypothetical protein
MALLWSLVVFLVSVGLHMAVWRVRAPRRHTRAIVIIFLSVLTAGVCGGVLIQDSVPRAVPWLPSCPAELGQMILLVLSLLAAYVITYSALEADSPTLAMIRELDDAGAEGVDRNHFHRSMSDARLVIPRLQDLLRDGMARLNGDRYVLTLKGRLMTCAILAHRRLMRRGAGG